MGIGFGSKTCYTGYSPSRSKEPSVMANPDPTRFTIKQVEEHGEFLIVHANYPNCTNYEGDKLLLFKGITLRQLGDSEQLDPHFRPEKLSPVARFRPDNEGWTFARTLAKEYKY